MKNLVSKCWDLGLQPYSKCPAPRQAGRVTEPGPTTSVSAPPAAESHPQHEPITLNSSAVLLLAWLEGDIPLCFLAGPLGCKDRASGEKEIQCFDVPLQESKFINNPVVERGRRVKEDGFLPGSQRPSCPQGHILI